MKCCHEVFGAASTWSAADDVGLFWWFGQHHEHSKKDWNYEIVEKSPRENKKTPR